jgi:hypothetical protein
LPDADLETARRLLEEIRHGDETAGAWAVAEGRQRAGPVLPAAHVGRTRIVARLGPLQTYQSAAVGRLWDRFPSARQCDPADQEDRQVRSAPS